MKFSELKLKLRLKNFELKFMKIEYFKTNMHIDVSDELTFVFNLF